MGTIKHAKSLTQADGADTTLVRPIDWNSSLNYTLLDAVSLSGNTAGVMASISSGTMYLAGGNNITLSQNANSVTVSAWEPIVSHYKVLQYGFGSGTGDITHGSMSDGTLWVFPLSPEAAIFPGDMTVGTVILHMFASHSNATASTEAATSTVSFGIYGLANATQLTRLSSGSSTWGSNAANANISSLYTGHRWLTIHSSNFNAGPIFRAGSAYWGALWFRSSGTSIATASIGMMAARYPSGPLTGAHSGFWFAASSSANSYVRHSPFMGVSSASFTTAMPDTIPLANMAYTGTGWGVLVPDIRFLATNAGGMYGLI